MTSAALLACSPEYALCFALHFLHLPQHTPNESTSQSACPMQGPKFLHDRCDIEKDLVEALCLSLAGDGGTGIDGLLIIQESLVCSRNQFM